MQRRPPTLPLAVELHWGGPGSVSRLVEPRDLAAGPIRRFQLSDPAAHPCAGDVQLERSSRRENGLRSGKRNSIRVLPHASPQTAPHGARSGVDVQRTPYPPVAISRWFRKADPTIAGPTLPGAGALHVWAPNARNPPSPRRLRCCDGTSRMRLSAKPTALTWWGFTSILAAHCGAFATGPGLRVPQRPRPTPAQPPQR